MRETRVAELSNGLTFEVIYSGGAFCGINVSAASESSTLDTTESFELLQFLNKNVAVPIEKACGDAFADQHAFKVGQIIELKSEPIFTPGDEAVYEDLSKRVR